MRYSISLKANGHQLYTEQDTDQPGRIPAGNTIREALTFATDHAEGFTYDFDNGEWIPATAEAVTLWHDNHAPEEMTLATARGIIRVSPVFF